ncbi:hypothetical protein PAPYR_3699 [Paratrimastix pyriformis]|uniref:Uncharacterized protein n=1 Tax=Paratrimastix pyriformis TaxID=342808 RepID=A0ABQ8URE9_9EUKA|nr:hypothetical protein PAPYR_3699 [Paratrimastix pyriformis]
MDWVSGGNTVAQSEIDNLLAFLRGGVAYPGESFSLPALVPLIVAVVAVAICLAEGIVLLLLAVKVRSIGRVALVAPGARAPLMDSQSA